IAWTALPTWPSFPPLMHEMLRLALAGRTADRNVLVGDDLTGIAPEISADVVSLVGPGGLNERLPIHVDSGERRWTYSHPTVTGIYEAQIGTTVQRYAVNVDPRE